MKTKLITFVEMPLFVKQIDKLGKPDSVDVLIALQNDLLMNPLRGDVIKGTGGARKARIGNPKRKQGKSGGHRYIYVYFEINERLYLLYFYSKNEQDSLTDTEKKELFEIVKWTKESLKRG